MCQRPGTAWQKAWTRPCASNSGRSVVAKTTPDVPSDRATTPGSTAPTPTAFAAWSPPPATTGVPARRPVAADAADGDHARHLRALVRRRHPGRVDRERGEDLGGPVARGEVEEHGPRTVGLVHGVLTGQPKPDVVLRQQDVRDPLPHVGLVIANPDELGRGEAGQGIVAGDRDEPLWPDRLPDQVALGGGPLVVPEDRGTEDLVRPVEEDGAVHLAGQPDGDARRRREPRSRPGPSGSPRPSRPTIAADPARSRAAVGRSARSPPSRSRARRPIHRAGSP